MMDAIAASICKSLESHLEAAKETAIKKAVTDFEAELRRTIANYAIQMTDYFSVDRVGQDIVIHVKVRKL